MTNPHIGQLWTLSERSFFTIAPFLLCALGSFSSHSARYLWFSMKVLLDKTAKLDMPTSIPTALSDLERASLGTSSTKQILISLILESQSLACLLPRRNLSRSKSGYRTILSLESRKSRLFSISDSSEERLECKIHTHRNILKYMRMHFL